MPIYEYQCHKCKTQTEVFQKVSDKPLIKCEKCGGRLEKLISAPAIQFKGSGWYVTDYAGRSKKSSDKSESDGGKDEKKTDEKKADNKTKDSSPATKSSSKASSSKVPSND
jgi:putative FmdB family regulatory protein